MVVMVEGMRVEEAVVGVGDGEGAGLGGGGAAAEGPRTQVRLHEPSKDHQRLTIRIERRQGLPDDGPHIRETV